jgi:hypothetical protein
MLVSGLCALAVAYVYQHSCSMRLARRLTRVEKERELLGEGLERARAELAGASEFTRLAGILKESKTSDARRARPPGQGEVGQPGEVTVNREPVVPPPAGEVAERTHGTEAAH